MLCKKINYLQVSYLTSPLASFIRAPDVTRQNVSFCCFVWKYILTENEILNSDKVNSNLTKAKVPILVKDLNGRKLLITNGKKQS